MNRSLLATLALTLGVVSTSQAGIQLFDNGPGTKQVAVDGYSTYILKAAGPIWRHNGEFKQIDDGAGTKMIAADNNVVYALKDNGHIWQFSANQWTRIGEDADNMEITASMGGLFVRKAGGNIWQYAHRNWNMVDDGVGTKKIYASGRSLWILKDNNHTWRYDIPQRQFFQFSRGNVSLTQDIVGDDRYCYILKGDGKVWRGVWSNRLGKSQFTKLGQGSKHFKLALDQGSLNVLTRRGNVWRWDRRFSNWKKIPVQPGTRDVVAQNGSLFMLTSDGQILRWSAGHPFAPQSSSFEKLYGE